MITSGLVVGFFVSRRSESDSGATERLLVGGRNAAVFGPSLLLDAASLHL